MKLPSWFQERQPQGLCRVQEEGKRAGGAGTLRGFRNCELKSPPKSDHTRLAHQQCHPERSEGSRSEILRGVYPERSRRAQNDNAERSRRKVYQCHMVRFRCSHLKAGAQLTLRPWPKAKERWQRAMLTVQERFCSTPTSGRCEISGTVVEFGHFSWRFSNFGNSALLSWKVLRAYPDNLISS